MGGSEQGAAGDGLRVRGGGCDSGGGGGGKKACGDSGHVAPSTPLIAAVDIGKPIWMTVGELCGV